MKKHLAKKAGITGLASLLFMTSALPASAGSAEEVMNDLFPEQETAEADVTPALFNQQLEEELHISFEETPDEAALGLFDENGLVGEMAVTEEEEGFSWSFDLTEEDETVELELEDGRYYIGSMEEEEVTYGSFIHFSEQPELLLDEEETGSGTAYSELEAYGLHVGHLELTAEADAFDALTVDIAEDGSFSAELPETDEDTTVTFRLLDPAGNETTAEAVWTAAVEEEESSEEDGLEEDESAEEDAASEDGLEDSNEEDGLEEDESSDEDAASEDGLEDSNEEDALEEEESSEEDVSSEDGLEDSNEENALEEDESSEEDVSSEDGLEDSNEENALEEDESSEEDVSSEDRLEDSNEEDGLEEDESSDEDVTSEDGLEDSNEEDALEEDEIAEEDAASEDGLEDSNEEDALEEEATFSTFSMFSVENNSTSTNIGEFYDGASGEYIRSMKLDLTALGFGSFPSSPSDRFGPVTMGVTEDFQRAYGLEVTGLPTDEMLSIIEAELNGSFGALDQTSTSIGEFYDGASGEYIRSMKLDLTALGFGSFPTFPSDRFGPVTMGVVEDFQRAFGLPVTGLPTDEMLRLMEAELNDGVGGLDYTVTSIGEFYDGASGEYIRSMKKELTALGFGTFPSSPSDRFGPVTMGVVEDFQRAFGLAVTGLPTDEMLNLMSAELQGSFYDGASGEYIRELKLDLTKLGFGSFPSSPSDRFGPVTMGVVEDFQRAYGLSVTGIPDQATLNAIEQALQTAFYDGASGEHIRDLKFDLTNLGFGTFPSSPSDRFGPVTMGVVEDFQRAYGLSVTGIPDQTTLNAIQEALSTAFYDGASGEHIRDLKLDLTRLGFGTFPSSPSDRFGPVTMGVVENFQQYYGLSVTGIPNQNTLDKVNSILNSSYSDGKSGDHIRELKLNLTKLGYGNFPSNPSGSYGSVTAGVVRDFQAANGLIVNGIGDDPTLETISTMLEDVSMTGVVTATSLNVRSGPGTNHGVVGSLANGTVVTIVGEQNGWYQISFNGGTAFVSASFIDTSAAPDPGGDFNGPNQVAYTNGSSLNVRSGPGTSHGILDNLGSNTRVEILSTHSSGSANSWHQIRYDGNKTGYVSAGYVQLASKTPANSGPLAGRTVVIDAGHGAQDPGGIGGGMREKDVVLDISLRAEELLRAAGAEVIMIRRTDIFLSLSQRAFIANRSGADAFLSVHTNVFNGSARGTETFWHSRFQASNSERLAHVMQDNTVAKMGTHYRRVDHGNYHVIRETQIPSALLEIGFKDYAPDAEKLRSDAYRQRAAEAIRDGFIQYFR
ncbi:peptidoglycan-binding protein [Bacillus daqingensis]|uniref:Peptidoglycan-binding protein n=1 Tax=Bacillus daqingensis TaxID=872396 RepID=A0ABV9NZN4_9BACI